jgi:c-di-GMP-binding flagellar brake protein YcgR
MDYSEKRDFLRMDMDCSLEYRVEGETESYTGQMNNLSATGIQFTCQHGMPPGSQISVTVTPLKDITPPMAADVTVARCDAQESGVDFLVAGQITRIY